jgi:mannosylfructose-phosphate synthase
MSRIGSPPGIPTSLPAIRLEIPRDPCNLRPMATDGLNAASQLPRVAMVSVHGYVAARPPLGAADTGGQVTYVLELSKKLAQIGYEIDIWTRRFEDQPEVEPVADRVRIVRACGGGREFISKEHLHEAIPEWSENALRFISRHGLQYRCVNSHYWDGGLAGQRMADALGVPHLHTPHSLGIWKRRQMEADYPADAEDFELRYNFAKRIDSERFLCRAAELVLATTPQQLDLLTGEYEAEPGKCRMVPPGYDDTRFFPVGEASRQSIRRRLGVEGHVILAIGRLARNKGYDLLIRAFGVVAQRDPEARLLLAIGGATMTPAEEALLGECKAIASGTGLEDRVTFRGFVADEDLADHYRAADVFALSSRYEPFGMTAIEAMACGTPTVVTVHGGLYRALTFGRHALYADPLDPTDLGIMILKILRHPRLRTRLSRMGSHKARSLFTWTGIAQQLAAIIERRPAASYDIGDAEWDEPWNDAD